MTEKTLIPLETTREVVSWAAEALYPGIVNRRNASLSYPKKKISNDAVNKTFSNSFRTFTKEEPRIRTLTQTNTVRYSKGLEFKQLSDGTYAVAGIGTCKDVELVIPPTTPTGGKVTMIGDCAFKYSNAIISVIIPNNVISIGEDAFFSCERLTSVTIPEGVKSIIYRSFSYSSQLSSVSFPNSMEEIGFRSFAACKKLTTVFVPKNVNYIGEAVFAECCNITSIVVDCDNRHYYSRDNCVIEKLNNKVVVGIQTSAIPIGVVTIGKAAFMGQSELKRINIPYTVTTIEGAAFEDCSGLTSIKISENVKKIDYWAFNGCSSLTIYCYHSSRPTSWDTAWNMHNRPVIWGYQNKGLDNMSPYTEKESKDFIGKISESLKRMGY
jgi:hypothetical protein